MVLAEDLRQAVLQAALQGKLTEQLDTDSSVDEMLENIQKEKEKLVADKKIKKEKLLPEIQDEDIPFEIPDNWRWVRLQSLLNIRSAVRIHQSDWQEAGVPFYRAREIVSLDKDGNVNNDLFISEKLYQKIKNDSGVPASNDLMVSGVGTLGRVYVVRENDKFYYKDASVLCFQNIGNQNSEYIKCVIKSPMMIKQIYKDAMGTTVATLTIDRANAMLFPLPPIEEQQRIVDKINEIMPKIDEYEKIEKELEAIKKEFPTNMKDALLQAAMQGKLTEQLESDSSVDEFIMNEGINILDEDDYPYFIPDNWRFVELGDLTSIPIRRGKSPKYFDKSGILVFAQKCNQKIGNISLDDAKYLDENIKHRYEQENYLQGNDIVINSTGGGTLGRIGYITEELIKKSLPIVPDSHVTTIRTKDNVLPRYIYFFLKINQPYLETMGVGSTNQTELRPDTIKELLVPLPPIEEQQRIVERLDALLPLCEDLKEE